MDMDRDVAQSSFYKELSNQVEGCSSEYPKLTREQENPLQQHEVVRKHNSTTAVFHEITRRCLMLNGDDQVQNKALCELRESFSLIELQHLIQPPCLIKDGDTFKVRERTKDEAVLSLFDLNPETLQTLAKNKVTKKHLEILKVEIQDYLLRQCNHVISFTFPEETFPPDEGMSAVVSHVSHLQKELGDQTSSLVKQRQYNDGLVKMSFQQVIEYGTVLRGLVENYRFSSHIRPHLGYLSLSLKAYLLKLRCLEKQILTYTYSRESVPVLKRLSEEVDQKRDRATRALAQVDHKLSAYQGLNPKFHELLREYSNLQKDFRFLEKT